MTRAHLMRWLVRVCVIVCVCAVSPACKLADNYLDPDGPRYSGDYGGDDLVPGDSFKVVSYNLMYGVHIDTAIAILTDELAFGSADLVLMQEMDAPGTDRIARALGLRYVYYPSMLADYGRDFGTAVLSRWPIVSDAKLILPHAEPFTGRRRSITQVILDVAGMHVRAYSVHTEVTTLGLGARMDQAQTVIDDAMGFSGPVVIGGDFNTGDPGSSDQLLGMYVADHGIRDASPDAQPTSEYAGRGARLDYVFCDQFSPVRSGTFDGDAGSDHRPVWADIAMPATARTGLDRTQSRP